MENTDYSKVLLSSSSLSSSSLSSSSSSSSVLEPKLFDPNTASWTHFLRMLFFDYNNMIGTDIPIFFEKNWNISIYLSIIYLALIYYGGQWMKQRPPFNLRLLLALWSGSLSLFSIIGGVRVWPEFFQILFEKGFVATYCDNSYVDDNNLVYWYTLFALSKVIELFDTAFIVLRKQKLIPLHWVHHFLTLTFTFFCYSDTLGTTRWMICMNLAVHSVMYAYYALKALRFSVPRPIAMFITTSQIIQMIFGQWIHTHALWKLLTGQHCQCALRSVVPAFLMYSLYFYYFTSLFIDSYLKPSSLKQTTQRKPFLTNENNHEKCLSTNNQKPNFNGDFNNNKNLNRETADNRNKID